MATRPSDGGAHAAPPLLARILEWPVRLGGIASSLLILVIFAIVVYAVVQRYILDTPLKWGDELLGYLLVATIMCGAAEALRRGDHIAIDLVPQRFGARGRRLFDLFSSVAALLFSVVLGISSYAAVRFSYDFGSYSPGYLEAPMWIPQSFLVVGAVLLGLAALARMIRLLAGGTGS